MVTSQDKVIQFHISRLKDRNPDVLLKTIKELVRFGAEAEAALPSLEALFKSTENPEVRTAAQQAGRVIFMAVQQEQDRTS